MAKKVANDNNELIDKEELTKEIKDKVINELEDYLINIVDDNSKNKLTEMEKRIYKYKNRTIRKKNVIILLLILIIILENILLYNKGLFNNYLSNDNKVLNNNTEEKIEKDLNYYIDKYGYLIDKVNTNLDSDNFNYLFKNNYKVSEIDNDIKLNISYMNINDRDINSINGVKTVSEEVMKKSYNTIFNDDKYEIGNFNYNCLSFIYNKSNLSYMAIDTGCIDSKKIIKSITKINEKDNYVEIISLIGITEEESLYDLEGNLIEANYQKEDLSKYKEKLNEYKYIFIKDKDNYYFDGIEKM